MKEKFQNTSTTTTTTTTTTIPNGESYEESQERLRDRAIQDSQDREREATTAQEQRDEDLIEFLRVSVNDGFDGNDNDGYYIPLHERNYEGFTDKYSTYFSKYMTLCFKYGLMFIFVSFNFIALSISLNCNVDKPIGTRIASALFAFFFGIVYIIVNYYTYRVLHQGKICKMNKEKLFPFEI
jgi:hypothetical protein